MPVVAATAERARLTPVRVVLAPDSFKESMTAAEAVAAMARGVARGRPDATVVAAPMADGGEGTAATLVDALGGRMLETGARDALGRPRLARIGLTRTGLAVVESAEAIGLALLAPSERDPVAASSVGLADLLHAAWRAGADRVLVGLGGSATTDAGVGMLAELGARVLPGPEVLVEDWSELGGLDLTGLDERLGRVRVAVDVTNPLLGPRGAAAVFAPQKGADAGQVALLERRLARVEEALRAAGHDVAGRPGAGAAGGLGAAFLAAGAPTAPGVDLVADAVGLTAALRGADLVLTGEGRVDAQTPHGKVVSGVARRAREAGARVVVLAGSLGPGWEAVTSLVDDVVAIGRPDRPLAEALATGPDDLADAAAAVVTG
ncbi:glycerate kinase [Actinotalea sp. M2MS4P-6]|uniref:glycerate kinase n=1 Tax=Actinotalea sp. M2MS4P-6 TaxID=2983762 RepID=UPI0021E389CD|nr:glycerate kinase [Actinotalea sp. M2MS4P-6]MCV2393964.1 glycerate kinase [Actinotalea sp. M2MS4P-6]